MALRSSRSKASYSAQGHSVLSNSRQHTPPPGWMAEETMSARASTTESHTSSTTLPVSTGSTPDGLKWKISASSLVFSRCRRRLPMSDRLPSTVPLRQFPTRKSSRMTTTVQTTWRVMKRKNTNSPRITLSAKALRQTSDATSYSYVDTFSLFISITPS